MIIYFFFFLSLSFFFSLTFIKKKVTSPGASVAQVGWGPAFLPMSRRPPATGAVSSGAPPCCEPHTWQPDCCKAGLVESRVVSPVICNPFCLNSGFIRPRPYLFKRVSGRPGNGNLNSSGGLPGSYLPWLPYTGCRCSLSKRTPSVFRTSDTCWIYHGSFLGSF